LFHFRRYRERWVGGLIIVLFLAGSGYAFCIAPPASFVPGTVVVVPEGASAAVTAELLYNAHVIRAPRAFTLLAALTRSANAVQAGAYRFSAAEMSITVLRRLVRGDFGISPARLTFFEGTTVRDMAAKIAAAFPQISASDFIAVAGPYEGYLFPDTYVFTPSSTATSITATLRANFTARTAALAEASSTHSFSDIVIMASLVEREARTTADKKMIAGILWNRIKRGMPLQVDAVFGYIYGRDTYSPSYEDLKVDSPYNTYTHTGLPPGPIDNPGLDSLEAAADPTPSNYLFYLTDRSGVMHYATTYAGHLSNMRAYLPQTAS
jgi:UPF0755 protein